jgi:hypothetical protein
VSSSHEGKAAAAVLVEFTFGHVFDELSTLSKPQKARVGEQMVHVRPQVGCLELVLFGLVAPAYKMILPLHLKERYI